MPLQNRVTPASDIVAVPERGMFMGNRGILHDEHRQLGKRRWAHKAWLICRTKFKNRQRVVMKPRRYTELFFFDEATAIAAGHRPCYECRREAFLAWQAAWQAAQSLPLPPRAPAMDNLLHDERINPRTRHQQHWQARFGDLPDGAFILDAGAAHLIHDGKTRHWTWQGYGAPTPRPKDMITTVLTPPFSVATLQFGYRPTINFSGNTLKADGDSDN